MKPKSPDSLTFSPAKSTLFSKNSGKKSRMYSETVKTAALQALKQRLCKFVRYALSA